MSKIEAYQTAIDQALEKLSKVNINARCRLLGFPEPTDGKIRIRVFESVFALQIDTFDGVDVKTSAQIPIADRILILHYLLTERSVKPTGEWISFRQFSGGAFYWKPFIARSSAPLLKKIGNSPEELKKRLTRYETSPLQIGDVSAIIRPFGDVQIALVYRCADEEFPPSLELLFDSSLMHVFCTEDIAVLASRVCIGMLRE